MCTLIPHLAVMAKSQIHFTCCWLFFPPPPPPHTHTARHASPKTIDEWSEGAEAMGSLSFIGHLVSIFLFLAIVTYLYAVLGEKINKQAYTPQSKQAIVFFVCVCICPSHSTRRFITTGPTPPPQPHKPPAYGRAVKLGRHATQARFLALALLGLGTWLFCFSLVGFPAAAVKDFQDSTDYVDKVRQWDRSIDLWMGP